MDWVRKIGPMCNTELIPEVAASGFAVVPVAVVPVTAYTAENDVGVNSGTAVGFSEGDTANNIKYCTNRRNKVIIAINDVKIRIKRRIPDQTHKRRS